MGCEKLPNNPVCFEMSGYVYESNTDPSIPIRDAKVLVGDVYDMTDSTGYFTIDNILGKQGEENTYSFIITHLMFDTLTETVVIKANTKKDFYLIKKEDFFPLAEGNFWRYDYSFKAYHMNYSSYFKGEIEWKVIESKNDWQNLCSSYKIMETFTGHFYYYEGPMLNWDSTYTDTTYFDDKIREIFLILQDRYNRLEFTKEVWVDASYWLRFNINRYQSPTIGDTLHIQVERSWEFQYADYVRNIGLVNFHWYGHSYHITGDETAKLIEYHIVGDP